MTVSRPEAAADFIATLMAGGYDEKRILAGPDPDLDEIDDRIKVDFRMETRLDSICSCLVDDLELSHEGSFSTETCMEIIRAFMDHVEKKGELLSERPDGVRYISVPSPDDDAWIIAQVATVPGEDGSSVFAGIYYQTSLLVLPEHTRRGIGSDLVVEHVLHNGGVLNWDLDSCAYSPLGEAAHLSALQKIEEMAAEASPTPGF